MKTRNGWVSNSSSSSFIIYGEGKDYKCPETINIGENGNIGFGWEYIDYTDFYSKLNFLVLNILYMKEASEYLSTYCIEAQNMIQEVSKDWKECKNLLTRVLEKEGVKEINWNLYIQHYFHTETTCYSGAYGMNKTIVSEDLPEDVIVGYIDHQSTFLEDKSLKRVFDSEKMLTEFLFSSNSKLCGGNDNEDRNTWLEKRDLCKAHPELPTIEYTEEYDGESFTYNIFNPYYEGDE